MMGKAHQNIQKNEFVECASLLAEASEANFVPSMFKSTGVHGSGGTYGKTEHLISFVTEAQTIDAVAASYNQTADDLLLANPALTQDSRLRKGQIIAVFDDVRLTLAKEMAATSHREPLQELVFAEILYATHRSATPEDLLPLAKNELRLRRSPEDNGFCQLVEEAGLLAMGLWVNQGRTHEVMDRLQYFTDHSNADALNRELHNLLWRTTIRSPTSEAVHEQIEILLRYGPSGGFFMNAVNSVAEFFSIGQVEEAAANLAFTFATEGPEAAASLLAGYTNPSNFDALTSARLLDAAEDTVAQIIADLKNGNRRRQCGRRLSHILSDQNKTDAILSDLAESVENASQSPEAKMAITKIATEIDANEHAKFAVALMNCLLKLPAETVQPFSSTVLRKLFINGCDARGVKSESLPEPASQILRNLNKSNWTDKELDHQDIDLDTVLDDLLYNAKQ